MNDLSYILQDLRDTEAALERLRRDIARNPQYEALEYNLLSLEKRERELRRQFESFASSNQEDICDYRIIPEVPDRYPVSAIGACLQRFQDLFSIVYDAVKTNPKKRARISADIIEQSTFNFGYSYAGSLGFAFTVPNERLLLVKSDIDIAAGLFIEILKCKNSTEIRELIPRVGVAAISRAYNLSKIHGSYALNTRVQWRKGSEISYDVVIHSQEFDRLREIIEETSESVEEEINVSGRLVGLDVDTDYFHMKFPKADDIKGTLGKKFSHDAERKVPGIYKASLIKRTRLHYSTGQEDVDWVLVSLSSVSQDPNDETDLDV